MESFYREYMRLLAVGISVLFFFVLESVIFFPEEYYFSFFFLFIAFILARFFIIQGFTRGGVLLFFFSFSSWTLLFFIDNAEKQHIFSLLSGVLFLCLLWVYFYWRDGPLVGVAKTIVSAMTIVSAFLYFSVLIGVSINYTFPVWILMGCMGSGVYFLTKQHLGSIAKEKLYVDRYSWVVGLFFLELGWIVQFWSFSYLTTGVILLILYYVLWDVLSMYVEGVFTRLHAWADILILIILTSMVLFTTPWVHA